MQMETNFAYIDENYKRIVDAIEEAKAKYRKPTDEITLMAVTKKFVILAVVVSVARVSIATRKSMAWPLLTSVDSSFEQEVMVRTAAVIKRICFFIIEQLSNK